MTVEEAIDVFAGAASIMRSFTYPCINERVGPAWVFRDAERKKPEEYRNEEWIAYGISPTDIDQIARKHTRGRYAICYIRGQDQDDEPVRSEFRTLRYRLATTEPFFVHPLSGIKDVTCPFLVERVRTLEQADRLAKAARRRQILPDDLLLDPPRIRQYWALDGDRPIGWVRSVRVGDGCWCSNLYVDGAYRRKGIGRTLMTTMLREDREAGASGNVLLASHTGAKLYRLLGFIQIGNLMVYTPIKSSR